MAWLYERAAVVDYFALLGQYAPAAQVEAELPAQSHPMRWFAELGVREGRARGHSIAAAAGAA